MKDFRMSLEGSKEVGEGRRGFSRSTFWRGPQVQFPSLVCLTCSNPCLNEISNANSLLASFVFSKRSMYLLRMIYLDLFLYRFLTC